MLPTVLDTSGGPGDTQPDHELGRAPPGARVMTSGVVINKFLELPRDTVAAYTGTRTRHPLRKRPPCPWGARKIYL